MKSLITAAGALMASFFGRDEGMAATVAEDTLVVGTGDDPVERAESAAKRVKSAAKKAKAFKPGQGTARRRKREAAKAEANRQQKAAWAKAGITPDVWTRQRHRKQERFAAKQSRIGAVEMARLNMAEKKAGSA